jgi:sialic acid synthase
VRDITLAGRRIADETPCYVIAEIGNNHGGSFAQARTLIQTAAACGADAVKFQKRDNATLYSQEMLSTPYEHEHSYGPTYGAHRAALEFGERAYVASAAVAAANKVTFFATAFDEPSLEFLVRLQIPVVKLASAALLDAPLLRAASRLGLPIILSTGGGSFQDVDAAVDILTAGSSPFALLHCCAAYPVRNYADLNLLAIVEMRARYPDIVIGWSGHVSGISSAIQAYSYGARIIEMHFTLDRTLKGTDHAFSLEPVGLRKLCRDLGRAHASKGDGVKRLMECEIKPLSKMWRHPTANGWQITGESRSEHVAPYSPSPDSLDGHDSNAVASS